MTGTVETTVLGMRVAAVAERVRELRADVEAATGVTPGPLLDELRALDAAARDLRDTRDAVLVAARDRGSSWNSINAATGVAATTWRGRLDRFLEGD